MMNRSEKRRPPAIEMLTERLAHAGWSVERLAPSEKLDLSARKGPYRYGIELKSVAEPRPDRVLPLLSQAILQAIHHSKKKGLKPLAVVSIGGVTDSILKSFHEFREEYAQGVAVGLIGGDGSAVFAGAGLESLNSLGISRERHETWARPSKSSDLFSDLNQWLIKVLLAPEVPTHLLKAPRRAYRSGAELADAAEVSRMSVSRFMRRCDEEGFLSHDGRFIRLVRRRELFRRWQAAAFRPAPELQMRYLLPGDATSSLRKAALKLNACVGTFAAADFFRLGHVSGAIPCLYVNRLSPEAINRQGGLVPVRPGELAQLTVKEPSAHQSLFRGAVEIDGLLISDVLQVWLDVSVHPSRGSEQASLLSQTVLRQLMEAHD